MQAFLARNPLGDTVGLAGQQLIDDASAAGGDVIELGKAMVATIVSEA